ncbi:hypothetical protein [Pseudomonas grimontii]|uniref:hypothetical protein n=1 Tax=Pseudomonas grimontii TaxID=129847 RepID=UPI0028EBE124|nr:hypothetical protein [Pseudomonas grimontii]
MAPFALQSSSVHPLGCLQDWPAAYYTMQGLWEAFWKTVIHRESPGFTSSHMDDAPSRTPPAKTIHVWLPTAITFQALKIKLIAAYLEGTRLAPQGLMCNDVALDIVC